MKQASVHTEAVFHSTVLNTQVIAFQTSAILQPLLWEDCYYIWHVSGQLSLGSSEDIWSWRSTGGPGTVLAPQTTLPLPLVSQYHSGRQVE